MKHVQFTKEKLSKQLGKVQQSGSQVQSWFQTLSEAMRTWHREDRKKKKYRTFRLQKRIKPEPRYVPSPRELITSSLRFIAENRRIFFGIFFIYLLAYFLIIRTPVQTDINYVQEAVEATLGTESKNSLQGMLATLGAVVGSGGSSQQNGVLVGLGIIIVSMAYVWATRQLYNKQAIKARDAYYQGMSGIFPVILMLIVLSLQLVPFAIASYLYTTARSSQIFVTGVEDLGFFIVVTLIGLLSFYWITSTIIAVYIASLPGMYPLKALSAAKKLVKFQRFMVFRRLLALPILLGIIYLVVLLFIIRFAPNSAFIIAEMLQLLMIPFINVYLYKLYRALL